MPSTSTPGKYPPHTSRQGIPLMPISKMGVGGARSATPKKARRGGGAKVSPVGGIETPQGPPGVGVCYMASATPAARRWLAGSRTGAQTAAVSPPVLPPDPARRFTRAPRTPRRRGGDVVEICPRETTTPAVGRGLRLRGLRSVLRVRADLGLLSRAEVRFPPRVRVGHGWGG